MGWKEIAEDAGFSPEETIQFVEASERADNELDEQISAQVFDAFTEMMRVPRVELDQFSIGPDLPFALIAGPCVIESEELAMETARVLRDICNKLNIPFIYKSSFDKANRTSINSYRGPGMDEGLRILQKVRDELGVMVLTDVHEDTDVDRVAQVVDVLQTPAFLCRQTNFIQRVARTGCAINIKKGQFLSPHEMVNVVDKAKAMGNDKIMVCERGVSFGYNMLVSDMRSLEIMRETKCPVVFDATHSVQLPGGHGTHSGGAREFVPCLARAAVAVGISALFIEVHPEPDQALSDGPNSLRLDEVESLLTTLKALDTVIKQGDDNG